MECLQYHLRRNQLQNGFMVLLDSESNWFVMRGLGGMIITIYISQILGIHHYNHCNHFQHRRLGCVTKWMRVNNNTNRNDESNLSRFHYLHNWLGWDLLSRHCRLIMQANVHLSFALSFQVTPCCRVIGQSSDLTPSSESASCLLSCAPTNPITSQPLIKIQHYAYNNFILSIPSLWWFDEMQCSPHDNVQFGCVADACHSS